MSWPERWITFRNRLLSSPRFQARAIANPLLRMVARRSANRSFDLCAGFVYSQVLLACVRTGLLARLADGPRTIGDLAPAIGLTSDATGRLLDAAASLDLAEPLDGGARFALGSVGATLLGNPSVLAMVEHHALFYVDLADPVALLKGELRDTQLRAFWAYAQDPDSSFIPAQQAAAYSRLMSGTQPLVTQSVLDAVDLSGHRLLLDVGGGDGTFIAAAARRFPQLHFRLFDLPAVAALAHARFEREGLAPRAQACGGSFRDDPVPAGADVITLVRVLHDHDDEVVAALLSKLRDALPQDGLLVVAEPMAGEGDSRRVGAAYFGLYLLAMGQGRPRTAARLSELLAAAGFGDIREQATSLPLQCRVVTARARSPVHPA